MDEQSISIINRSNTQVIGEKANALPIKLVSNLSWVKIFFLGFFAALILVTVLVLTIRRQVVVVDVAGQSTDYKEYRLSK